MLVGVYYSSLLVGVYYSSLLVGVVPVSMLVGVPVSMLVGVPLITAGRCASYHCWSVLSFLSERCLSCPKGVFPERFPERVRPVLRRIRVYS